ncbi:replication-relaxation family protein [Nocardia terpenica]|uniref:replication-relaxation family protein n=1 Tax=Nocardia terpenica TaxID=455432 RepID=UPI0018944175|nr:replication-relaxation family protein [Nocardia terpenica]MBF6066064.1 replication-relaxation family protein [Nocardia terpenica]MBF6109009.1 replication-relaxation family protein [Nocardia terpenica]MBF6116308.1 replication-relaxation family protein [Nocardia terpenica]MBF6123309.1 replication-relaxation family protein [Nocardia terpenica]MBF6156508.1 replication-relaxation family protein [Nocardia terpenica]
MAAQRQLTSRDLHLLHLLATHRVLTSVQIARLLFASDNVARKRLAKLTARGIVARFRICPGPGSVPWRYTLGPLGAMITAADHGHGLPAARKTQERMLRLSRSQHLEHLLGINEFFSLLAAHARDNPGCGLRVWLDEREATRRCAAIARPDGYGEWTETGTTVAFFLEFDNGTEPLADVAAKLAGYHDLADAGRNLPVLFVFTGPRRHTTFTRLLTTEPARTTGLVVATTTTADITACGPAGPIWHTTRQHHQRLAALGHPTPLAA